MQLGVGISRPLNVLKHIAGRSVKDKISAFGDQKSIRRRPFVKPVITSEEFDEELKRKYSLKNRLTEERRFGKTIAQSSSRMMDMSRLLLGYFTFNSFTDVLQQWRVFLSHKLVTLEKWLILQQNIFFLLC